MKTGDAMWFMVGMCVGASMGFLAGAVWAAYWARSAVVQMEEATTDMPNNVLPFRRQ